MVKPISNRIAWLLASMLATSLFSHASAQESTTRLAGELKADDSTASDPPGQALSEASDRVGGGGGAPMADFGSLMNLIQNTVDPDNWLAAGGTSSMLPYPAGVWIDPRGRLQRMEQQSISQPLEDILLGSAGPDSRIPAGDSIPAGGSAGTGDSAGTLSHRWHLASPLRVISLRRLDQLLSACGRQPKLITPELLRAAGLRQVHYVRLDLENRDVLLAGPADGNLAGCFLDDIAVVFSLIRQDTSPFGCSIEPAHEQLLNAQQFISTPQATRLLGSSPERFVARLTELMGAHEAEVFGMNPRCSTAVALLAADEHMKQVGFGKASLPVSIDSYFELLDRQSSIPHQSIVRWWFDYSDEPVVASSQHPIFRLPDHCIRLLSERQMVTLQGRQPSGDRDPAADAFAEQFSRHLQQLRGFDPNYSRMCCVFEMALAAQLALDQAGLPDFSRWFPTLCGLGVETQQGVHQPKHVDGLAASHQSQRTRTNVAVVSGGVLVSPKRKADRNRLETSALIGGTILDQTGRLTERDHWWWD
jgi:hypothetical protein